MTQHYQSILTYIKSKVKDSETARDLTQEVFLKLGKSKKSDFTKPYIYTVAKNTVIDYYRQSKHVPNASNDIICDESSSPPTELTCQLENCLEGYIDQLNDESKKLIIESDLKGVRQKDLATKLGVPYVSLRTKIQRGRKKLRAMFDDECHLELSVTGQILGCEYKDKKNSSC